MTDLATIYTKAADWLEAHEWYQGNYRKYQDGVGVVAACMVGACGVVAGTIDHRVFEEDIARRLRIGPTKWNDAPGRTKAEVIAKLREAASQASAP